MAKQSAAAIRKAWLKQHAAGERLLTGVLRKFFKQQTKRVYAAAIKEGDGLTPAVARQLFDAAAERELMAAALAEPLIAMMATGAEQVWKSRPKAKASGKSKAAATTNLWKKAPGDDDDEGDDANDAGDGPIDDLEALIESELEDFSFSDDLKEAIADAFTDLQSQDYWGDIQSNVEESITDILTAGLEEGLSGRKLAKRLAEVLGAESEVRAAAIARTETTAAYAAGQQASYSELAADGVQVKKEWLAVVDDDTRASHADADGQTVGVDEDFTVGGEKAPYPGHASLSAKQRVNCRCTTAGSFE